MRRPLLLIAPILIACGEDAPGSLGPEDLGRVPVSMKVVAGDGQQDTVGAMLVGPMVVRLATEAPVPAPVTGIVIIFSGQDCGRPTTEFSMTNSDGEASGRWQLGTKSGPCTITASALDASGTAHAAATLRATTAPGAPHSIRPIGGSGVGSWLADTLDVTTAIEVRDRFNNGIPNPALSLSTLPAGFGSQGARVWASRESRTIVAVKAGAVGPSELNASWYRNLSRDRWRISYACIDGNDGAPIDSLVASAVTASMVYESGPPRFNGHLVATFDGKVITYRGARADTAAFPSPRGAYQHVGAIEWFDQPGRVVSDEATPTRYEGTGFCSRTITGSEYWSSGRPMIFEVVR